MKFVLTPAAAFPTLKNTRVIKVTYKWMTGRQWHEDSITCTPNHRFLTLDGRWVEAQNLTNERLMPFWRWRDDRYAGLCVDPISKRQIREHRFIAEQIYNISSDQEVHHINENKLDNRIENLIPIAEGVHQSYHSSGHRNPFYGKTHTDETRAYLSTIRRGRKLSDSHCASLSKAFSGSGNPRYVDISLGQIVEAYQKTGKIADAADVLGIHEGTLSNKIKEFGFASVFDFRRKLNSMDNHKVVSVEDAGHQDTYDINVPRYENFVANGVVVHNSGYVDPGFVGTLTLELINFSPVIWELRPGDRLVQLVMMGMTDAAKVGYALTGRYQGQTLPTAPKGWEVEEYHCG